MEINDFIDLTDFIGNESAKNTEYYGIQKPSETLIKFVEKETIKYSKLYAKPLLRAEKRKIQLQEAIDTMPHNFLWKIFHWDLWQQIKSLEKEKNLEEKVDKLEKEIEQTKALTPIVVTPTSPTVIDKNESEND